MLPCLLASPTLVRIGGAPYLARPLTLHGFGVLLRNGADALGMDGDAGELPEFGSDAFQAWLKGAGSLLLAWECLRRDNPVTLAQCEALGVAGGRELLGVALRRARTAIPGKGEGKDVARLDWAAMLYRRYEESGSLPPSVAELTLDQAWLLASGGKGFDPPDESAKWIDEAQAMWEQMHGEKAETPPAVPVVVPEGVDPAVAAELAGQGLLIVPEAGE